MTLLVLLLAAAPPRLAEEPALVPIAALQVSVESGQLVARQDSAVLELRAPMNRFIVPRSTGTAARLRFTWQGPTRELKPLASGELRQQVGLKLKAQNQCNLVYVMWRLAPVAGVVVQVKSNPGLKTHAECGDQGYRTVQSSTHSAPPVVTVKEAHELAAFIEGDALTVLADGQVVWAGTLPDEARAFEGPAGLRSDNGAFDVEFFTAARGPR